MDLNTGKYDINADLHIGALVAAQTLMQSEKCPFNDTVANEVSVAFGVFNVRPVGALNRCTTSRTHDSDCTAFTEH